MSILLLGRVCRTCLFESSIMHKLLDAKKTCIQIEEMLNATVPNFDLCAEMDEETPLPVEICSDCWEKLQVSYSFQQMCLHSNERLRNFFTHPEDVGEVELSGMCMLKSSEQLRDNNDNENNLQEVFKIEISDEIMTVASFDDGNHLETVKEEPTAILECLQEDNNAVKKLKEEPGQLERVEINQSVNDNINEMDGDFKDVYCPSDDKESNESNLPNILKNPINRIKRKYIRRAPPRISSNKTCPDCHRVFKKRMYLTRHMSVHSLENHFVCEICEYRFATAKLLTIHNSRKHSDVIISVEGGPYQCPDCPMLFDQTRALAAHRVMHLERDFKCEICGACLKTLGAITRHMNCKHPGVLPYKCEICEAAFPVETHYNDHINMHKGYKKHKCEMCDKSFPNTTALKDHMRTHTGESPYLCSHCGKSFKTTNVLRQHLQRHGEKNFQCPKCPLRFSVKSNLRQHMCTHTREKPHVCDICGSTFSRPDSLKTHRFKHSGERPFKCDQCNLSFVFKSYLMRHKARHTGEKPHSCSYCDRAYASSGDLVKHLRTHVGENTYFCDICPQTFRYQHDLRDHKNKHYKETCEATKCMEVEEDDSTNKNKNYEVIKY